jgi:hypothetical protein
LVLSARSVIVAKPHLLRKADTSIEWRTTRIIGGREFLS